MQRPAYIVSYCVCMQATQRYAWWDGLVRGAVLGLWTWVCGGGAWWAGGCTVYGAWCEVQAAHSAPLACVSSAVACWLLSSVRGGLVRCVELCWGRGHGCAGVGRDGQVLVDIVWGMV